MTVRLSGEENLSRGPFAQLSWLGCRLSVRSNSSWLLLFVGSWLLVVGGCWLLIVDCRCGVAVVGCGCLLVVGCWCLLVVVGFW